MLRCTNEKAPMRVLFRLEIKKTGLEGRVSEMHLWGIFSRRRSRQKAEEVPFCASSLNSLNLFTVGEKAQAILLYDL